MPHFAPRLLAPLAVSLALAAPSFAQDAPLLPMQARFQYLPGEDTYMLWSLTVDGQTHPLPLLETELTSPGSVVLHQPRHSDVGYLSALTVHSFRPGVTFEGALPKDRRLHLNLDSSGDGRIGVAIRRSSCFRTAPLA